MSKISAKLILFYFICLYEIDEDGMKYRVKSHFAFDFIIFHSANQAGRDADLSWNIR